MLSPWAMLVLASDAALRMPEGGTLLTALLLFTAPLAVSWLLSALLIRWAPRLGLLDHPGPRKVHQHPTPRAGGLAVAGGAALGACLLAVFGSGNPLADPRWLFAPAIVVLGLIDDLRSLPWWLRLCVQTATTGLAVFLWTPSPEVGPPGWLAGLLAVFWTVSLINAFNMIDNMDLLAGGVAWIAAGCLALTALFGGPDPGPNLVLMGALTGFLWFNRPPARLFLGDSGSTFLGFFLGIGSAQVVLGGSGPVWRWFFPLCVLAAPLYDLVTVVWLRLRQGRSPFRADRQHLSHRLAAAGFNQPSAVLIIHMLALAGAVSGLALYQTTEMRTAILLGAQFVFSWFPFVVLDVHITRRWFMRKNAE
jgi:UDP-GlcNAc:undecaprenyl-phosphate/decaprenyl-phosphate GlcNAc-1-phosphate transferase